MNARRVPSPDHPAFAERLRRLIDQEGSGLALARKAGVSPTALRAYLQASEPSRVALIRPAQAANVTLEWLTLGQGTTPDARRPGDTAGTESRMETLRVAAKTRFRIDDWMDETEVERALTELLTGHAGEPVTVGDYTTVDGTECGYLLRVFFQTGPSCGRWS